MSIIFGLDLGQTKDLTALVGAEMTTDAKGLNHYAFKYLKRFLVGTPYTSAPDSKEPGVVEFTDNLLSGAPFAGADPVLAIDQTGVGRPVVDRFRATNRLNILPITITGGGAASPATGEYGWHVPKKILVTTVQVLLQSRRLTFAKQIPESAVLVKELQNFKVKITLAANEQFSAWREGDHDDLVLAVAMACWVGENVVTGSFDVPRDPSARSMIEDAPDGCFLVDATEDDEESGELDRP